MSDLAPSPPRSTVQLILAPAIRCFRLSEPPPLHLGCYTLVSGMLTGGIIPLFGRRIESLRH
jgi:hypothetical protein